MIIPIIISLAISIAVLSLSLTHNIFQAKDFFKAGSVFGATEEGAGVFGLIAGDAKNLNNYVSGKVKKIGSFDALATSEIPETLPKNIDAYPTPIKKTPVKEVELNGRSGVVLDLKTGKLLFDKNAEAKNPIASISKLMTVLVFLDHNPGWDRVYEIKAEDVREGGKAYLSVGDKVRVKDLFYLSLVASDNMATIALIKSAGLTETGFVELMNGKAAILELKDTHFSDPVGLADANISTALEVARFARAALSNEEIKKATLTKKYEFITLGGKNKVVYNTDNLLSVFPQNGVEIKGGKTGYTEAAGYCFVGEFTNKDKRDVLSVVLGSDSKDARFTETHKLVGWAYENYIWQ